MHIITLLVSFKNGHKVSEMDITGFTDWEVEREIANQKSQGRTWEYQQTTFKEMKERRESYDLFNQNI